MSTPFAPFRAESAATTLETTPVVIPVGVAGDVIPDRARLNRIWFRATAVDLGKDDVPTVSWFLAADAAGDQPLTSTVGTDLQVGATTDTKYGSSAALDIDWSRIAGSSALASPGLLWVIAQLEAPAVSASVTVSILGEQR